MLHTQTGRFPVAEARPFILQMVIFDLTRAIDAPKSVLMKFVHLPTRLRAATSSSKAIRPVLGACSR